MKPLCRFCNSTGFGHKDHCICKRHSDHSTIRRMILEQVHGRMKENDQKHGGPEHDDTHSMSEWCAFINQWTAKCMADYNHSDPRRSARSRLLDIAALAVAAIESLDRKCSASARSRTQTPAG